MIRDEATFVVAVVGALAVGLLAWFCGFKRERRYGADRRVARWRGLADGVTYFLIGLSCVLPLLLAPEIDALTGPEWLNLLISAVIMFSALYLSLMAGRRLIDLIDKRLEDSL